MNTRTLLRLTHRIAMLALPVLVLAAGTAIAGVRTLNDGAVQNDRGGWDLPPQGTCPAGAAQGYTGIDTRPECVALRLDVPQASCTSGNGMSWTTSGVCNDLVNTTQAACQAAPNRLWNPATGVCAVVMMDEDRNNVVCAKLGGTWVTTGTCIGSWTMPARTAYTPTLLTGTGPGDQCLRCHNDVTQYNGPRVRDTEETMMMGHKNMSRKVVAPKKWGGPHPFACSLPGFTTMDSCIAAGGTWDPHTYATDDAGNLFDWTTGTITVGGVSRSLTWIYGDWLAPLPRSIYKAPASTSKTCTDPRYTTQSTCEGAGFQWVFNAGASYSCGRCHTTGWTSDATINTAAWPTGKEPELSFPGITWDRSGDAPADVVNLSGGVAADANRYSSWDNFGITCTRCHSSSIDTATGTGNPPQYSAPAGMSSHHNNLTLPDLSSGACTDIRFTREAECVAAGGQWRTACSQNPTPAVCTMAANTSAKCAVVAGTWVPAPGWCSNAYYGDQATCTANGFTWQDGWCTTADPQATCTGGSGDGAKTWRLNGTMQSCMVAGATWSLPKCSSEGLCNLGTAFTTPAACTSAGGQWAYATDIIRCEDAGGRWTGNHTTRGQLITALCMDCHRQENKGLPYTNGSCSNASYTNQGDCVHNGGTWTDSGNGLPVKVGPYHSSVDFISHPHGQQFLNSPHGEFTGKFSEIGAGVYDPAGTGLYKSSFQTHGEAANTGNGCTGCHDVHTSVVAGEEPFHEECTDCHTQDLATINHVGGTGTPLEHMNAEACITCHMPGGLHLFRVNTDASYTTFPMPAAMGGTVNANTAPDGTFNEAVWVDLDASCGQCHGGGTVYAQTTGSINGGSDVLTVVNPTGLTVGERILVAGAGAYQEGGTYGDFQSYVKVVAGTTITLAGKATHSVTGAVVTQNPTKNGAPYYTRVDISQVAKGMHDSAPVSYPVTFIYSVNGLTVSTTAQVTCQNCPSFTYDWIWGDGSSSLNGGQTPTPHTYATGGRYPITLVVRLASNGLIVGSVTRSVQIAALNQPPTASGNFSFNADTWTATLFDTSTDPEGALSSVRINWGDGTLSTSGPPGQIFAHVYKKIGNFTVTLTATDAQLLTDTETFGPVTTATFSISGTVMNRLGTLPLSGAAVRFTLGSVFSTTVYTAANGTFSVANLKPGTYKVTVTKFGYSFANPAANITVGPNSSGTVIYATAP